VGPMRSRWAAIPAAPVFSSSGLALQPALDGLSRPAKQAADFHRLGKPSLLGEAADMLGGTAQETGDFLRIDQSGRSERGGALGHGEVLGGVGGAVQAAEGLSWPSDLFMGAVTPPARIGPQKIFCGATMWLRMEG
jgi:hypothetical protein